MLPPLLYYGRRARRGAAAPNLLSGLVSYWKLDEAATSFADSVGANTLTDHGGVVSGTPFFSGHGAAAFVAASSQYLSAADAASLSFPANVPFMFAGWALTNTLSQAQTILAKGNNNSNSNHEYRLDFPSASNRYQWLVGDGAGHNTTFTSLNFGSPTTGTWHLIFAGYDPVNGYAFLQIDNTTPNTSALTTGSYDSTFEFRFGRECNTGTAYWNGRLAGWGLWNRMLTPTERNQLWANGNGRIYPFY